MVGKGNGEGSTVTQFKPSRAWAGRAWAGVPNKITALSRQLAMLYQEIPPQKRVSAANSTATMRGAAGRNLTAERLAVSFARTPTTKSNVPRACGDDPYISNGVTRIFFLTNVPRACGDEPSSIKSRE